MNSTSFLFLKKKYSESLSLLIFSKYKLVPKNTEKFNKVS